MPLKRKWNTPGQKWNGGGKWNEILPDLPDVLAVKTNATQKGTTAMEYWEVTKERAEASLPVWQTHTATLKIKGLGHADLEALIDGYEPKVQARTLAQDDFDETERVVARSLLIMKILAIKIPAMIEAQLSESDSLMDDLNDIYTVNPKTEPTILKRARMLYPVWERANTAMAALTPAQPPIKRVIAGTEYTSALLKNELDTFTDKIREMKDKESVLNVKRMDLRKHDRATDQLSKRWYKAAKAMAEPGSDLETALQGIPIPADTPAPEPVEILTVTQGGEDGLEVLVAYVPGGGDHSLPANRMVKWQKNAETNYPNEEEIDPSGNALGPFVVGDVVKIITEVTNSSGVRTVAPRTITIETPI
jgi:hypothetical protein